jgi:hypothetical protein
MSPVKMATVTAITAVTKIGTAPITTAMMATMKTAKRRQASSPTSQGGGTNHNTPKSANMAMTRGTLTVMYAWP